MDFRKADIDDIQQLTQYRKQQLIDEGQPPVAVIDYELEEYFKTSLMDGSLIMWLAIDGEETVATSGVCFYQLPPTYYNPTGMIAYITNMYTLPQYRKRGIASRLLQLLFDEAKNRNYKIIRLHASVDGKPIYSKAGFVDSDGFMTMKL